MDAAFDMGDLPSLCEQYNDFKVYIVMWVVSVLLVTFKKKSLQWQRHTARLVSVQS